MKKLLLSILLVASCSQLSAQEFNKWSVDVGGGVHSPIFPLASGYDTDNPDFWQANLGFRYMFNEKFGMRLDLGFNQFTDGKDSNDFKSNYYRASLEGVVNAGNLLNFKSWTNRINLLIHGGAGFSKLYAESPTDRGVDNISNLIVGITPQFKLSDRISLFLDLTAIGHFYQSYSFDGVNTPSIEGIDGGIINASIGLNIALGKNQPHADWYNSEDTKYGSLADELVGIQTRLMNAEKEIASLKTNRFNKSSLVNELDTRYAKIGSTNSNATDEDFIKQLLEGGYVNVYFNFNKTSVQEGSMSSIYFLRKYMMDNPSVAANLTGYADKIGDESYNKNLSEKRAKKVYDILISSGIKADRLSYNGAGEDDSTSDEARQFSRIVTFKIK